MRLLGGTAIVLATMTAAIVACGDDDALLISPDDAASDAALVEEEAAPACLAPEATPAWLDEYLETQLKKLTGVVEIEPDAALIDRATVERRTLARTYLKSELEKLGITATIEAYATGANVVGRLAATSGSDGKESILIGAHYDGVARTPGANDNATGVAAVLAIAKMLTLQTCREHDVVFVMFDEEELGLVGSTAFAAAQPDGGAGFKAVHTIDQVGWDEDDDKTFELERPTTTLLAEYQSAAEVLGVKVLRTSTNGSDHQPLRERGYPAIGITEEYVSNDTSPHRHQPTDTAATVNRRYLALAVRLVDLVVARELGAQ